MPGKATHCFFFFWLCIFDFCWLGLARRVMGTLLRPYRASRSFSWICSCCWRPASWIKISVTFNALELWNDDKPVFYDLCGVSSISTICLLCSILILWSSFWFMWRALWDLWIFKNDFRNLFKYFQESVFTEPTAGWKASRKLERVFWKAAFGQMKI